MHTCTCEHIYNVSYLHQIPTLQGLRNDGGHRGTDTTEDHQVFGTIAYGIKESPQPLGVVTLQTQRKMVQVEMSGGLKRQRQREERKGTFN